MQIWYLNMTYCHSRTLWHKKCWILFSLCQYFKYKHVSARQQNWLAIGRLFDRPPRVLYYRHLISREMTSRRTIEICAEYWFDESLDMFFEPTHFNELVNL